MNTTDKLTLALVILTGAYTLGTFLILWANRAAVKAMRDQIDAQSRPYISIAPFVRTGTTLVCLRIKNTGLTGARNIKMSMDRSFFSTVGSHPDLSKHVAFTEEIESLPPGAELLFVLGVGHVIFGGKDHEEKTPKVFTISAEYKSLHQSFSESTTIDLRPYVMTDLPHDPIADEIKELRRSFDVFKRTAEQVRDQGSRARMLSPYQRRAR